MTKEKLYERQKEIGEEIIGISNKAQEAVVRRSTLENRLHILWEEFEKNHSKLLVIGSQKDNYFKENYFEGIKSLMKDISSLLIEKERKSEQEIVMLEESNTLEKQLVMDTGNTQHSIEVTSPRDNLMRRYHRLVDNFKALLNEGLEDIEHKGKEELETIKSFWQQKFQSISTIFAKLTIEMDIGEEEIENKHEEIENAYHSATMILIKNKQSIETMKPITVKLEDIKIPYFYGDINEWCSFYDLFKKLVHDVKHFSNVEKMYRLKTLVKGEAGKLIQHLQITDANYDAAWNLLDQRFKNRRLLFTTMVDKILDQPVVKSESASSIKQLLDTTNECMHALRGLNIKLDDAEPFIARIVIRKLDNNGLRCYEQNIKKTREIQALSDVTQFLETQYQALEAVNWNKQNENTERINNQQPLKSFYLKQKQRCLFCNLSGHEIKDCRKFQSLTIVERRTWARNNHSCYVCLNHTIDKKCMNTNYKCKKCDKKHHILLHSDSVAGAEKIRTESMKNKTINLITKEDLALSVLLATAQVKVKSGTGEMLTLRALIDQGSQKTTISEEAAQMLNLPRQKTKTELIGLGNTVVGVVKAKVKLEIRPRFLSNEVFTTDALILSSLVSTQPDKSFKYDIAELKNYTLADPDFNKSDRIDIVIGGDLFHSLLVEGIFKIEKILGQRTKLGWILSGVTQVHTHNQKSLTAITNNLEKFWELEEIDNGANNSNDDWCLQHYCKTTQQAQDGRFIVKLPFKKDNTLGDSKKQAMARFLNMERKLENNTLKTEYIKFMKEYQSLGHMVEVNQKEEGKYYLPHQAVIRESSTTTKIRVVFDASAKSSNSKSLNDILHIGPRLQKDIVDIIIKWRFWKFAVTADIEKMYRQVKVTEEDQDYQYILWRENKKEPIKQFKLTTVTYGISSAPFLATRTLHEIANRCNNTDISKIIKEDFYMDDLMTGADTVKECQEIQRDISAQLQKFGFHLRKWTSNSEEVTRNICNAKENEVLQIQDDETIKTLGLQWNPRSDKFMFSITEYKSESITKRKALSYLAKIFDPLGWLAPITITAKLFIQNLWTINSDWDDNLEADLVKEWTTLTQHWPTIKTIGIPRWICTTKDVPYQLHGFADASGKAYGAIVYIKIGSVVSIIAAKTKVNPIKNRKTLPKLELCAANLLAKLLHKVKSIIDKDLRMFAWSDSLITLHWIKNNKNKDKFIRTRTADILELTPSAVWNHVNTKQNPADLASRGISAAKLEAESLWWKGPSWLAKDEDCWPKTIIPEDRKIIMTSTTANSHGNVFNDLQSKYSAIRKLERVVAYVLRFIKTLKGERLPEYLTAKEIREAEIIIIKNQQAVDFTREIHHLKNNNPVSHHSKIANLNPFLDKEGVLRVGGRLEKSEISFNCKHPAIIGKSGLATLLVRSAHIDTLHGGNRIVISTLMKKYWIIGVKNMVKKCIHTCVKCTRYRQKTVTQIMGNLPEYRVCVSHPFTHTGIDYAGPLLIRTSKGRGHKAYKGYIAMFVCMTTKAVHIEAVSDLTTEAFLAALRRFFARRGKSQHIYTDNGTNFVGASRKMDSDFKQVIKNNSKLAPVLESERIQWHFTPPAGPHFGGIWEASVKSMKHHLRRIIGETKLTYEELSTLLSQIEAVLNSRPLYALSNSTEDIEILTPGHFLIGHQIIENPEVNENKDINPCNRWRLIQKMKAAFWKKWKNEYLLTLQQRYKWKNAETNLSTGQVVIVKNDDTYPSRWPLGRIIETHPGSDGKVRVVTIKTQNGTLKRPIQQVCPLETAAETEECTEQVQAYTTTENRPKRNRHLPSSTLLIGICMMFLLMITNKAMATTWTPTKTIGGTVVEIKNNTAIYIDTLSKIEIIKSNWNMIIYYNLSSYIQEVNTIQKFMDQLGQHCKKLPLFRESCILITTSLEERYNVLKVNNELFAFKNLRKKRAPFEFVGSIYHILFGMMDADDRLEIEADMNTIIDNQQNLNKLFKKQTSVIDSTINILKKTTDDVNRNLQKTHDQLNSIRAMMIDNQNKDHFIFLFQILVTQISMMIEECERVQTAVINLLIDINHGRINTNFLHPSQLQKELLYIKDKLPEDLKLPGAGSGTELKEVYNLMRAKGMLTQSRMIIKLQIPLLARESSTIYKIIPLPILSKTGVIKARIKADYIVYNFLLNSYFLMTPLEVDKCKTSLDGTLLCHSDWPWISGTDKSCEISSLKQSRSSTCQYERTEADSFWVKLSNKNKWLYKLFSPAQIQLDCGNVTHINMELPIQGVLSLESGCTARYNGVTLSTSPQFNSESKLKLRSSAWVENIEQIADHQVKPLISTLVNNSKDIDNLREMVYVLQSENMEMKRISIHHVSGHIAVISVLILVIIMLCIYIRHKCKNNNRIIVDFSPPPALNDRRQNVQN